MAKVVLAIFLLMNSASSRVLFQLPKGEAFLRQNHLPYVKKIESANITLNEIFDVMQTLVVLHDKDQALESDPLASKAALVAASRQIATLLDRSGDKEYQIALANFNQGVEPPPTLQTTLDSAVFFVIIFLYTEYLKRHEVKGFIQTFNQHYEAAKSELDIQDNACVNRLQKKPEIGYGANAFAMFGLKKYLHEIPVMKSQLTRMRCFTK